MLYLCMLVNSKVWYKIGGFNQEFKWYSVSLIMTSIIIIIIIII